MAESSNKDIKASVYEQIGRRYGEMRRISGAIGAVEDLCREECNALQERRDDQIRDLVEQKNLARESFNEIIRELNN